LFLVDLFCQGTERSFETIHHRGILVVLDGWAAWTKTGGLQSRALALTLFAIWLCLEVILVRHHAFWRDEVRALSLATRGDLISMIESLRGEGHPALWYLLIRGAYFLVGSSAVLWIVSVGVASAAALLLVLRSPFGWPLLALFLFGRVALFEYSVMARNYGISMLLMFLFAACYERYRDRSLVLGVLLFLLANTNAHSALLVGAFLLFWSVDVVNRQGLQWAAPLKTFLLNFAIASAGVLAAFATIYPPSADAIPIGMQAKGVGLRQIALAIFEPARSFGELTRVFSWEAIGLGWLGNLIMSLVLFGSILGLVRSPGAFVAALATLIGFSLFFTLVYPGYYRQEALWLVFLLSMYWITRERELSSDQSQPVSKPIIWTRTVGSTLMVLLVATQLLGGFRAVADVVDNIPQSRSRDFSYFIKDRPNLRDAIIIADPDSLLEALPYYIDNPLYLMHEQRFGNVRTFTNKVLLSVNLDDILNVAKKLNQERGKPVVILLAHTLDPGQPAKEYRESYSWKFSVTPDQVRRFLASTQLLVHFAPAKSDESFDAYLFDES
jgi:hypothetical protein